MKIIVRTLTTLVLICSAHAPLSAQWVETSGYNFSEIRSLAFNNGYLYVGTQDSGAYISSDNGATWTSIGLANIVKAFAFKGEHLFAADAKGVHLSTDNGANWISADSGLGNVFVLTLLVSGGSLFAGTANGVFLSTNDGASWTEADSGLTSRIVWSLAALGRYLFAGTYDGHIFISSDTASTWRRSDLGVTTSASITSILVSGEKLYAGAESGGVFLSTDSGNNWQQIDRGISCAAVSALALSSNKIFAATSCSDSGGIYLLNGNGISWTVANSGLTDLVVNALAVSDSDLFAAAANVFSYPIMCSVWKRPLSQMVTGVTDFHQSVQSQIYLRQNYPNPFNPTTTISYFLPSGCHVTLKLYDILGRELKILVNEHESPGRHSVTLKADLDSGIYFYRLQAGNQTRTKKLVLLR